MTIQISWINLTLTKIVTREQQTLVQWWWQSCDSPDLFLATPLDLKRKSADIHEIYTIFIYNIFLQCIFMSQISWISTLQQCRKKKINESEKIEDKVSNVIHGEGVMQVNANWNVKYSHYSILSYLYLYTHWAHVKSAQHLQTRLRFVWYSDGALFTCHYIRVYTSAHTAVYWLRDFHTAFSFTHCNCLFTMTS